MAKLKVLLLAGTREGVVLNQRLLELGFSLITSLAGVTKNPPALKGRVLPNGFQEVGGLSALLQTGKIDAVIDATHPFAAQMSKKACAECESQGITYLRYHRRPWQKVVRDQWINVCDMSEAGEAANKFKRLFLTIGRKEVVAFEQVPADFFLLRSVEEVAFNPVTAEVMHIRDRGPFQVAAERELLTRYQIDAIVSKNSGGAATYGKIEAARDLGIPVIMITPPEYSSDNQFSDLNELISYLKSLS